MIKITSISAAIDKKNVCVKLACCPVIGEMNCFFKFMFSRGRLGGNFLIRLALGHAQPKNIPLVNIPRKISKIQFVK